MVPPNLYQLLCSDVIVVTRKYTSIPKLYPEISPTFHPSLGLTDTPPKSVNPGNYFLEEIRVAFTIYDIICITSSPPSLFLVMYLETTIYWMDFTCLFNINAWSIINKGDSFVIGFYLILFLNCHPINHLSP